MSVKKEELIEFLNENDFMQYKRYTKDYYFRKRNIKFKIRFNRSNIVFTINDDAQSFTSMKTFKEYFSPLFLENPEEAMKEKPREIDFKKMHDIHMQLFYEDGDKLYYITRDLQILKKIYKKNNYESVFTLINQPLTKEEEKMFEDLDLEQFWYDKVGWYEEMRERRIRGEC